MAAILHENLADDGTVTASSWIAAAPPSMVQNPHVSRRWKGNNGDSEYILLSWGSAQTFDTIALFGLAVIDSDDTQRAMSVNASHRIRVSSVDPTGLAGDVFDSTQLSGAIREEYGTLIKLLPSPVSGKFVRIDLSEASMNALMAGRLVVGSRHDFTLNFDYGWSFGFGELSRKKKSLGGQTFIERDDRYRVLSVSFNVKSSDRYGFVYDIDRICGESLDVLFVIDKSSSQLDRDCVWGLIQDIAPPAQPNFGLFQKSYKIEERR